LLLGFAAVNTGNNLIYLIVSALLGFMAVSGILGRGNLAGVEVTVDLPAEIYDGTETLLQVRLHNRRRLPACLIQVQMAGQTVTFPLVERRSAQVRSLPVTFFGRGRRPLEAVLISSIFPINFFLRRRWQQLQGEVTVFPAPRRCLVPAQAGSRQSGGELRRPARGYEGDLSRIGDYRGGEPLKMIHWKLSARHGALKVKELSAVAQEPVLLDLAALPGAHLEERLRSASYLVNRYLREQRPVGLRLGARTIPADLSAAHKHRLLTVLALHGQSHNTP
jgi:uncharacterized protein (DUF58 family)